ncbi:MAG: SGNH/GDSL hydrolase family protein [Prevotellaceae bacterium]|nr:SGNH/GDSL hydrolase family protein [Prevotellaceae bacterium]MDY3364601.1 SGNH/GDSL hydrolase family protein [Prevotella sp.]
MKNKTILAGWLLMLSCSVMAQQNTNAAPKNDQATALETMDAELATQKNKEKTQWIDALNLGIEGVGWKEGIANYTRLPYRYQSTVTPNVWRLSRHSAGLSVRFTMKGSSFIDAKWTLSNNNYMPHMTSLAVNGLDLYVRIAGQWQWAGVGKPTKEGLEQHAMVKTGFLPNKTYECMLYLPLYTGVTNLQLGFSPSATITPLPHDKRPIVMYGTSILHGCSASRAGMPFASMIGRYFDMPVVNLGFSGNGLMENHFADILSEIEASLYVIDCLPNMGRLTAEEICQRTLYIVRELRKKRPYTPILLVEDRSYTHPNLTGRPIDHHRREGQMKAYKELKKTVKQLYYIKGNPLLGSDNEAAVDGSHPSDLGMMRYFEVLRPVIKKALKKQYQ